MCSVEPKLNEDIWIYLASPYTHPNPNVRQWRFEQVCKKAAELMDRQYKVFSPIAHSHPISQHNSHTFDHEFWYQQNLPYLKACDELWIYELPDWVHSNGIAREKEFWSKRSDHPVMRWIEWDGDLNGWLDLIINI